MKVNIVYSNLDNIINFFWISIYGTRHTRRI